MLCIKIFRSLFCLNCVEHFINYGLKAPHFTLSLQALFVMVHSNLAYGINVYGCANKTSLEKLVLKQLERQAFRIICNASYRVQRVWGGGGVVVRGLTQ
jgi:hypothetical protein